MVVLSNQRLGPSAELLVSREVAAQLLGEVAAAAGPAAEARWEHELVAWLEGCAGSGASFDVSDIAWTPEHFEYQRHFLLDAVRRAAATSRHARHLLRWRAMIEAFSRESVQVGRRWRWPRAEATI